MSVKIHKLLTLSELDEINSRVRAGVDTGLIIGTYKKKYPKHLNIIRDYIYVRRQFIIKQNILGRKDEPYYEDEEDMIIPKYTEDDLSPAEKEILTQLKSKS